ncbi:MAG TPA: TolC family protein [Puia sp.]|jgi:outer membrane protein TolC|nr:TolC family protein [Puia sp.]
MNFTSSTPSRIFNLLIVPALAALLLSLPAQAQHVPGGRNRADTVPLFRNSRPSVPTTSLNPDSLIQERLVQLALNGPSYSVSGHQIKFAEYNLIRAKRTWLNLLSVSADYNDQSFKTQQVGQYGYVYPKYFFGITIPIGLFFTMGPDIKKERENVAIAHDNQELLARTIRAEVLGKYAQYKAYGNLLTIQNNVVDDEEALRKQVEKKFQDGSLNIEQYNAANKIYGEDLTKKLNLQLEQDLLKIDIERMIGVNLESVLKIR